LSSWQSIFILIQPEVDAWVHFFIGGGISDWGISFF
jgi:hypothetical protein